MVSTLQSFAEYGVYLTSTWSQRTLVSGAQLVQAYLQSTLLFLVTYDAAQ